MGTRKQSSQSSNVRRSSCERVGAVLAIARELGIGRNQLYKWQTELRARGATAFPGPGARKERTTKVARLKRALARVTEERDILKKAARYFAKESV